MKAKLNTIREALEYSLREDYSVNGITCTEKLTNAQSIINTLIADQDSPEMVGRVAKAIADVIGHKQGEKCRPHAKAAINAIKG